MMLFFPKFLRGGHDHHVAKRGGVSVFSHEYWYWVFPYDVPKVLYKKSIGFVKSHRCNLQKDNGGFEDAMHQAITS